MNGDVREILGELKAGLGLVYGRRLKGVYLFGSYARDEQDSESDLDILVVLESFDLYGAEVDRTSQLISELSLRYEISISRVFVSWDDWLKRQTPFLANVREEGIPA
jgi:predicted nucleotidyltransferase